MKHQIPTTPTSSRLPGQHTFLEYRYNCLPNNFIKESRNSRLIQSISEKSVEGLDSQPMRILQYHLYFAHNKSLPCKGPKRRFSHNAESSGAYIMNVADFKFLISAYMAWNTLQLPSSTSTVYPVMYDCSRNSVGLVIVSSTRSG